MCPRTRLRSVLSAGLAGALSISAAMPLAGCTADPAATHPAATDPASQPPAGTTEAQSRLAAHAAAAKDQRYAALYTLSTDDRADRTVVVTRATDGSWRVDIPGGALGGTADVSVARTGDGLFQCALPSPENPVASFCVSANGPDGELGPKVDPRVQHVFVDWLEVLTDRDAAISVSTAPALNGVEGECFSVESNSASLAAPLDVGIYCYASSGMFTGARLGFGTLALAGTPAGPPATVTLPGPIVPGEPLSMASPPAPPTTTAVTPTAAAD